LWLSRAREVGINGEAVRYRIKQDAILVGAGSDFVYCVTSRFLGEPRFDGHHGSLSLEKKYPGHA